MPSPDAVWVRFEPEGHDQHWSLLANDEKQICDLPCDHWIAPQTGAFLQYDRPGTNSSMRVAIPEVLGRAGSTVVAVARPEASARTSTKLMLGGVTLAILGLILFGFLDNRGGDSATVAVAVGAGLGVPLLGAGVYLRIKSHPADVSVHTAGRASAPLAFGLAAPPSAAPAGATLTLTPFRLTGTF